MKLSEREVDQLIHTTGVLTGGLSGHTGVKIKPGRRWQVSLKKKELHYNIGVAAALPPRARIGVIGHEIAHFRETRPVKLPVSRGAKAQWAHYLWNIFEDRRVELRFVEDFPGMEEPIRELRRAFESPMVPVLMAKTKPHMQFLNGLYSALYDSPVMATHPDVVKALQRHLPEIPDLETQPTTRRLVDQLFRPGGIWDSFVRLLEMPFDKQGERLPPTQDEDPDDEDEGEDEDQGTSYVLHDDSEDDEGELGPGVLPELSDDEEDDGDFDDDEEGDGDDPADQEAAEGEDDGDVGDEGSDAPAQDESVDVAADEDPLPTPEDLAAMTDEQKEMLDDLLSRMENDHNLRDDEREQVRELRERINESNKDLEASTEQIWRILRERDRIDDDTQYRTPDQPWQYQDWRREVRERANVLGRNFESVLRENRFDRWSVVGYDTGPRVNPSKLSRVGTGDRRVFRRRTRPKNRQYAVSLFCDVSSSMSMVDSVGDRSRLQEAMVATTLCTEALERTYGIDYAVWAFGSKPVLLKPYEMTLEQRAAKIGGIGEIPGISGATCMGRALARAASITLDRYDERWNRLFIVITDGLPNSCGDPECRKWVDVGRLVRQLEWREGIECVAVGIQTPGNLRKHFSSHTVVQSASELPNALADVLRARVRKAVA